MSNSSFIDKIKNELNIFKKLQNDFPDNVKITSLENLVFNTKPEMKGILRFLNLDENEICFHPSYNGNKIISDHIKKINDDEIAVDKKLLNYAKLRFHGYKHTNKNSMHFSVYLKFFLFNFKKLFKNLIYLRKNNNLTK